MLYISPRNKENNKITYKINYTEKEEYTKKELKNAKLLIPILHKKKLPLKKWINVNEDNLNNIINELIFIPNNIDFEPNNIYTNIDIVNFRNDIIKFLYENTSVNII